MTQIQQVVEAIRDEGGFATLKRLSEKIDFTQWKTKTPEASVRRIVQLSPDIFKIRPGLWALEECREDVLRRFDLRIGNTASEERFSHGYYQGMLVEIGNLRRQLTYVPAQDKNRLFLGRRLGDVARTVQLPQFTHERLLRRAKTVDVIWFNERVMPASFYEVEHTTDIKSSLLKFYELQDFSAQFWIVADKRRKREFEDKKSASIFSGLQSRVRFMSYDEVVRYHAGIKTIAELQH